MSPELSIPSTSKPLPPLGRGEAKPRPAIPDHELIRCIGQGAYGEVWLARNVLGAYRAVKVVHRTSFRDERAYEREFRGIQQFEPLSRTNDGLLDVLQAGRNDEAGHYYYVMELADDASAIPDTKSEIRDPKSETRNWEAYTPRTLGQILEQRGRLPPAECVQLGLNLTLALGHLHRHGLIHRDIKPANIIFVGGIPKLADIGLVTSFADACSFVGTEGFIAPEGPTSPRADLFSLGKVLYEISTGKDRKDFPEPPTALGEDGDAPGMPELNAVILRACAGDPKERYQTAEEFHADLALLNSGKSVRWKRMVEKRLAFARKAGAVVGLIATLAMSGYLYQRHQTSEARRQQARWQIQHAEGLFARGDSSLAVAQLAAVLRDHPANRVAAERIMAALNQRNFPRRAAKPFVHATNLVRRFFQPGARLSPDGEIIVTATMDGLVHFWSVATGAESVAPVRYARPVTWLEFTPDGAKVAIASEDGTVRLVDGRTGLLMGSALRHDGPVWMVTFDASGRFLATAAGDSKARIFAVESGERVHALAHSGAINAVAFSPDSRRLATGSEDERVRVWGVASGQLELDERAAGGVHLVRFSPDGKWLGAATEDRAAEDVATDWQVGLWHLESRTRVAAPLVHDRVYSLEFSPDSRRLVTADLDNVARVWEVDTGRLQFALRHSSIVHAAAYSPDGRQILTASADHTARLWDAETGVPLAGPIVHEGRVLHAEFSRSGQRVLTAGWEDRTANVWDVRPLAPREPSRTHDAWVVVAEFSGTGNEALTATDWAILTAGGINQSDSRSRQSVCVWDPMTGAVQKAPTLPEGAVILAAQFTPDGPKALVADGATGNDGVESRSCLNVQIWDLGRGTQVGEVIRSNDGLTCARFSPDGHWLATGSEFGRLTIHDARRGSVSVSVIAHQGRVQTIRWSGDGQALVTASSDGSAAIWDAGTGKCLARLVGHTAAVWLAQFNAAGDRVVTASRDYTAAIWSTDGARIAQLRHNEPVEYGEFSPDGSTVATAAGAAAHLWRATTGRQLPDALQHEGLVTMVRFSPDSLRVMTASADRTAQVWDVETGLKLGEPFRHDRWVVTASFSPDGRRAITGSVDGTAKIREVPMAPPPIPLWLPELAEAMCGRRLSADGGSEPVAWTEQAELEARLTQRAATDAYIRWVKRFFEGVR